MNFLRRMNSRHRSSSSVNQPNLSTSTHATCTSHPVADATVHSTNTTACSTANAAAPSTDAFTRSTANTVSYTATPSLTTAESNKPPIILSLSSCPYSTKRSHPDHQHLTVPPFRSSVFKLVKHFGHSFAFDAPKM